MFVYFTLPAKTSRKWRRTDLFMKFINAPRTNQESNSYSSNS